MPPRASCPLWGGSRVRGRARLRRAVRYWISCPGAKSRSDEGRTRPQPETGKRNGTGAGRRCWGFQPPASSPAVHGQRRVAKAQGSETLRDGVIERRLLHCTPAPGHVERQRRASETRARRKSAWSLLALGVPTTGHADSPLPRGSRGSGVEPPRAQSPGSGLRRGGLMLAPAGLVVAGQVPGSGPR